MNRTCPNCRKRSVPVSGLIVSACRCHQCGADVNVRGLYRFVFAVLITLVTVPSTAAVFLQQGIYAALLWLPFPIGALGFVRARFCPLTAVPRSTDPKRD